MNIDSHNSYSEKLYQSSQQAKQLPVPGEAACRHSQKLVELIKSELSATPMTFQRYMEIVLYQPELGYYSAGSTKLGDAGDFITAPEISSLFSYSVASALTPLLKDLTFILEAGAGSGVMAADILSYLEKQDSLPTEYWILELSADLKQRQQATIREKVPHLLNRVKWLETIPESFSGIVLANELLDAMPVQLFQKTANGIDECFIDINDDRFVMTSRHSGDDRLTKRVDDIEAGLNIELPDGYISEVNFAAEDWIKTIAQSMEQGLVLLVDYGFPRSEYYHTQRSKGTLMCHYRHRTHDDPFVYPGLQDITAHVDFTAMADAALSAGMKVTGYTNQASFLMGAGLTEIMDQSENSNSSDQARLKEYIDTTAQVKKLTLPHEMGELFKVIGFTKNITQAIPAFQFRDMREYL